MHISVSLDVWLYGQIKTQNNWNKLLEKKHDIHEEIWTLYDNQCRWNIKCKWF